MRSASILRRNAARVCGATVRAAVRPTAAAAATIRRPICSSARTLHQAPSPSASSSTSSNSSSADPAEILKFGTMAAQWWDVDGQVRPLHLMNPVRVNYIRQQVRKRRGAAAASEGQPLAGLDVLDVGCGGGLLSESLARLGGRVHGIDAAAASVEIARLHAARDPVLSDPSSGRLRYSCATAESLLGSPKLYDVVCSLEVVEHVTHAPSFLHTLAALVKPGGMLFVSTINQTNKSWLQAIVGAEYVLQWVPVGTHDWHKFLSPPTLSSLIEHAYHPAHTPFVDSKQRAVAHTPAIPLSASSSSSDAASDAAAAPAASAAEGKLGMRVIDVCGMTYDPLRSQWSLNPNDTDCNYILTAVRPATTTNDSGNAPSSSL